MQLGRRLLAASLALVLASGCYASHEIDERPTGPWRDVAPPEDGPALVVDGEPIAVGEPDVLGAQPSLVWNGHGWGATWGRYFRVLDADGAPIDDSLSYGLFPTLDFADDRYGISSQGARGAGVYLATYDESAERIAEGTAMVGTITDIGRLSARDQWILAATFEDGSRGQPFVRVQSVDDDLVPTSAPIAIGSSSEARVASLGTRALAVWNDRERGIRGQVLRGRRLELSGEAFALLGTYPVPTTRLEVEAYRDRIAVAVVSEGRVSVSFADLWTNWFTAPVDVSGPARATSRPGLAVAEDGGFVVACWARSDEHGIGSGVALQVVGDDGALWGEPLEVALDHRAAGVDCGWNGRDVIVLGWDSVDDGAHDVVWSLRVHPTFF